MPKTTFPELLANAVKGAKRSAEGAARRGEHVQALTFLSRALGYARAREMYFATRGKPTEGRLQVNHYYDQVSLCAQALRGDERIEVSNGMYVDRYGDKENVA